jgi:hypothetical protein
MTSGELMAMSSRMHRPRAWSRFMEGAQVVLCANLQMVRKVL